MSDASTEFMSTILYNTSSSLVPKFQRHNLLRQQRELSPGSTAKSNDEVVNKSTTVKFDDIPFKSKFEKNSDSYLRELCCSVYPSSLHHKISKLDPSIELPIQAFMSLVWHNFVSTWYGVKIPTCDDRFMIQLFDLVQAIAARLKLTQLNYETFVADDLPSILGQHLQAMSQCIHEDDVYGRYCQLISYKDKYYPQLLTDCILDSISGESTLQATFVQALFNELLMGKIMDRVSEPYFALSAISKACRSLESGRHLKNKRPKVGLVQRCKEWVAVAGKTIAMMTSMNRPSGEALNQPFSYANAFTFIFVDLLKVPARKPYLYAMGKTLQYWSAKSRSINIILHNMFLNFLKRHVSNETHIRRICISLRQALFPGDNKMGAGRVVPVGAEFEAFKGACVEHLWQAVSSSGIECVFAVNHNDVEEFIEIICKDKKCNQILIFKIVDCMLAHTNSMPA